MTPEIRAFEFALGLYSVLIGLAIADIAGSVHRLARRKDAVRWDPLALLAAGYALLLSIGMWFDLWGVRNVLATRHFFFYLCMIALLFVLFLIAAASLPDDPERENDLRRFYLTNRRYFWLMVALFQLCYLWFGIFFAVGLLERLGPTVPAQFALQMSVLFAVPLGLAGTTSRAAHYLGNRGPLCRQCLALLAVRDHLRPATCILRRRHHELARAPDRRCAPRPWQSSGRSASRSSRARRRKHRRPRSSGRASTSAGRRSPRSSNGWCRVTVSTQVN